MDDTRPSCLEYQDARRKSLAKDRGRGYLMFFAAMYASPFIGTYLLGRWGYRHAERHAIERRRKRICRRAEDRDIARRPSQKPQVTEENSEHSLLRLPVELRLQIYDYIYSPANYIIITDSTRKGHVQGVTWSKTYCPCVRSGCCTYSECTVPITNNTLALPMTCRLLYAETIAYVYGSNTFHFNQYQMITSIPGIIPAKHMRNIRSLSLNFSADKLINSLNLISRNPSAKPNSPSYKFNSTLLKSVIERQDQWMLLWRSLATNLVNLQRFSVTLNRMSPKGIPSLEKQTCEWVVEPLFVFGDAEKPIAHFEVCLGFAWKDLVPEMKRRLVEKCLPGKLPFNLKQTWGCIHDFY